MAAVIALTTALFSDWFKERFGFKGATNLLIKLDHEQPYLSHAWIRHVSYLPTVDGEIGPSEDDSLRLKVLRLLVANEGHNAAKNVSVWLTEFCNITPGSDTKPNLNVIALRWADTWRFVTDKSEGVVSPSEGEITFPVLPSYSSKFCDFGIWYAGDAPKKIDRFERGRFYLAIFNMPSRTYSLDPGRYRLSLQVVAENARPARVVVELEFDPSRAVPLTVSSVKPQSQRELKLSKR